LRSALSLAFWYKSTLENYLRTTLGDHPELLSGINFHAKKREIADNLVDRLVDKEYRYQLEESNRSKWLPRAKVAVADLKSHTRTRTFSASVSA
jgi:hypothetical protein